MVSQKEIEIYEKYLAEIAHVLEKKYSNCPVYVMLEGELPSYDFFTNTIAKGTCDPYDLLDYNVSDISKLATDISIDCFKYRIPVNITLDLEKGFVYVILDTHLVKKAIRQSDSLFPNMSTIHPFNMFSDKQLEYLTDYQTCRKSFRDGDSLMIKDVIILTFTAEHYTLFENFSDIILELELSGDYDNIKAHRINENELRLAITI